MAYLNNIKLNSQFTNSIKINSPLSFPFSKIEEIPQKEKSFNEKNSTFNFNFFNEINSPFSSSNSCTTKTTNIFSQKKLNCMSSLLTQNYDINDECNEDEEENNDSKNESNNKNIFDILSKHLIYQGIDSETSKNESFDDDEENFNNSIYKNNEGEEEEINDIKKNVNHEKINNNNDKINNTNNNNNEKINNNNEKINNNNNNNEKNNINNDKINNNNNNNNNEKNNNNDKINNNNDKINNNNDEINNKNYISLSKDIQLIINNFLNLAKEQSSCRFLQQKINSEPYIVKYIFPLILNNINELITHPYGNYLIQNIFFFLSEKDIIKFIDVIKNDIVKISMNFFGTRVIQKLIDFIHNQNIMLNLLYSYNNYSIIANDIFASHIIIKLLSLNQMYITSFIYEKINKDLVNISINRHGCCIIKKILEYKSSFNDTIINNIINNSMQLITDQYGHYTILYIIQSNMRVYKQKLILMILPHFIQLSLQIYSSSVLEKCFEFCEDDIKGMLYQVLGNANTLKLLICDKYGNYVVQKAILKTTNDNMRIYLFRLIISIINDIKKDNFGKQFYVKLCKSYPDFKKCLNC